MINTCQKLQKILGSTAWAKFAPTVLNYADQPSLGVNIEFKDRDNTTLGAVLGPNLVESMGRFALLIGVPPLAGPFILSSIAFILAGLVLFIMLRPDPLKIITMIEAHK